MIATAPHARLCVLLIGALALLGASVSGAEGGTAEPVDDPGPWAEETSGERSIPAPPLPGLETVPRGLLPGKWETWATGQDVERIHRLSVEIAVGFGGILDFYAGAGRGAPGYGDISGPGPAFGFYVGYKAMPSVSVFLSFLIHNVDGNEYSPEDGATESLETYGNTFVGAALGLKLQVPFSNLDGMFRMHHARANTGLSFFVRVCIGLAIINDWQCEYRDFTGGSEVSQNFDYFTMTTNVLFSGGPGFEYRWTSFAVFIEVIVHNFGAPNPSDDPLWVDSTKADILVSATLHLGIGYHF